MAKWNDLYNVISKLSVDSIITYDNICSLVSIEDISGYRGYVYRAVKELETHNQRTMECVKNIGYRVVHANEHERLIHKDVRSIKRKTRKAVSKAVNVKREDLTVDERRRIDDLQLKLAQTQDMIRRLDKKKADRAEVKEVSAQASARMDTLETRLEEFISQQQVR